VWQILYDIGPDPVTAKRRQRSKQIHGTEAQALLEAERIAQELDAGLYVDDSSMTVADLIEAFLAAKAHQLEPSSLVNYRHALKHLEPISRRRINQVSGGALTLLYSRMLEAGHSAAVVHSTHRVARAMFRSAVRWGYLRDDPTFRAEVPRYRPREMTTWSGVQLSTFLEATTGDRLHVFWLLAAMTGMRRGEVAALQWSDIDLTARTVTVTRNMRVVDGRVLEGKPKTASGRRTIALDDATVEYLRVLRASRPTGISGDWVHVVCKPDGMPYNPASVSKAFDRTVARLDLPRIRLHDLRHSWASLALEAGVHIRVVADRLGHSSPTVTLNVYSHSTPKLDRAAAEAVSQMVGRG
jgi:integrase